MGPDPSWSSAAQFQEERPLVTCFSWQHPFIWDSVQLGCSTFRKPNIATSGSSAVASAQACNCLVLARMGRAQPSTAVGCPCMSSSYGVSVVAELWILHSTRRLPKPSLVEPRVRRQSTPEEMKLSGESILGVDCIVPSKNRIRFPRASGNFLERRIPRKN